MTKLLVFQRTNSLFQLHQHVLLGIVFTLCSLYNHNVRMIVHKELCCLRFVRCYEQKNLEKYVYGRMYYDADYVARTRFYLDDEITRRGLNELKAESEYKKNFPDTFREAFNQLCRRNSMTQDDVADALHMSLTALKERLKDPETRISADFIIQLMLLWQLPDWLTRLLMDRAYVHLSETNPRHLALLYIMRVMWMDGISKANEYLVSMGMNPLSL